MLTQRQQKNNILSVLIIAIIASTLFEGVQIAASFDYQRLRLIDYNNVTSSYLFRGNAPLDRHGRFDPTLVINSIQGYLKKQQQEDQQVLKEYDDDPSPEVSSSSSIKKLIVVSLLSKKASDENSVLQKELSFRNDVKNSDDWDTNGQTKNTRQTFEARGKNKNNNDLPQQTVQHEVQVSVLHRAIVGSWVLPPPFPLFPHVFKQLIWTLFDPSDGTWEVAQELQWLLQDNHDAIVYIHCMRGIDRTGLLSGTYMLRYLQSSATDIHSINYNVGHRPLNWPARKALEWVIWYTTNKIISTKQ